MRRGIMIFNVLEQEWKIWIGQQSYGVFEGMFFELRIQNRYYQASLGKDEGDNWFVTLEKEVTFDLRNFEVYKVRTTSIELNTLLENAPF